MSLMEGVLQLMEDAALRQKFSRVTAVWLEIGQLAGVEAEAMRFCFDAATRGSVAEGATLEILTIPGSAWCAQCSASVAMSEVPGACPLCGTYQLRVTGGTEMRLKELEVG
jgi:hydrogenase nickel incorporation protein HypA/HybF